MFWICFYCRAMANSTQIEWTGTQPWKSGHGLQQNHGRLRQLLCRALLRNAFRGVPNHPFQNGFDLTLRPGGGLSSRCPGKRHGPRLRQFDEAVSSIRRCRGPFVDKVFETHGKGEQLAYLPKSPSAVLWLTRYLNQRYPHSLGPVAYLAGAVVPWRTQRNAGCASKHLKAARAWSVGKIRLV